MLGRPMAGGQSLIALGPSTGNLLHRSVIS